MGQVDIEDLVEKNLKNVSDWELNFKMLKSKGREADKLPKYKLLLYYCISRDNLTIDQI